MSMMKTFLSNSYEDGRTKQSFEPETDIRRILAKAQIAGGLSHLEKHGAFYGDFEDFDFKTAMDRIARGRSIFEELPSELRREFDNDPARFFEFVGNKTPEELAELIPVMAAPGRQFPDVGRRRVPEAAPAAGSEPASGDPDLE